MSGGAPTRRHPRDIDDAVLADAVAGSDHPRLLEALAATSRRAFGFHTAHRPHTLNYPWIVARLLDLPAGARILDIGAGVSPVPLLLAAHGHRVTGVDNSALVRRLPVDDDWNEWGFFDYAAIDPRIESINASVLDHAPASAYDAVYSISVLAHMPADVRERTLAACARWLRPGGTLLLAVDLIPASDFLWNRSQGRELEPPVAHGTSVGLVEGLQALGFAVVEHAILRAVPDSRTDLMLVRALAPPGRAGS